MHLKFFGENYLSGPTQNIPLPGQSTAWEFADFSFFKEDKRRTSPDQKSGEAIWACDFFALTSTLNPRSRKRRIHAFWSLK